MCIACAVYDSCQTEYQKSVVLLCLSGLSISEVAHANVTWLMRPYLPLSEELVIPMVWGCACGGCSRMKKGGPWKFDTLRGRVINLSLLGPDGTRTWTLIAERNTQLSQTQDRLSTVAKSLGVRWSALAFWGPHFLRHRFGLSEETIAKWHNKPNKIWIDPPFRGYNRIWDSLSETYKGLQTLYPSI